MELDWEKLDCVQEICMLAPTRQLAEKARGIIAARGWEAMDVVLSPYGRKNIMNCAKGLGEKGARIIVSRKGSAQIVKETTDLKVVSLNNTLIDYLQTLRMRGLHTPGLVAVFSYDPMGEELQRLFELVDIQVKNYIFKTAEDCDGCVEQALRDGAVYSIGGAWTAQSALERGLPHVILENSEESIVNALEVADQIRRLQREEEEKQRALKIRMETYQAVLDFTHDAILSIDEEGRVQVMNPVAERIMGCRAEDVIGRPVDQVLPNTRLPEVLRSGKKQVNQIMKIHQTMSNTNRIPIEVNGQIHGAVATFQDVRQLQSAEQKIRLKLHEKGLVAKYFFSDILGESSAIKKAVAVAQSYAASQAAVLIHGETGTGKELFAQSIHNASARRDGPFVALNCAAVNSSLLESELFGYEAGAFTGASKGGREGLFELAHGGTIFLDEIGDIPRETQVELLRVLQEKEIRRVGGDRVIPVDVRIITATNRDLPQEVAGGSFRQDLYYRLDVLDLELPPLRARESDARILGLHLFRQMQDGEDPAIQARFLELLDQVGDYPWYGNIRELQNFVERTHILLRSHVDIRDSRQGLLCRRAPVPETEPAGGPRTREDRERAAIREALEAFPASLEEAARSLGCSRQTLWRKMKKYGITR